MRRWYVAHTQPNSEIKATFNLQRQGFGAYLPRVRAERRHARRVEQISRPLFPRYLFVSLDPGHDRWRSVNGTFGVRNLITQGNDPIPVPKGIVESFKSMEDNSGLIAPEPPSFRSGQRIEILSGPMAMHVGLFHRMSDKERVVLLLNLLGQEVTVTIPFTAVVAA